MTSSSPPVSGPLAEPLRTHARADTWFRLRRPDDVAEQTRELVRRELELAAEGLWVSPGPALDAGVLYARSAVEKVRVLIRLLRGGMPKKVRKSANRRLKKLGKQLGKVRDTGTLEDVVERIRQSTREPQLRDGLMVLGGRLAERRYRESASQRRSEAFGPIREALESIQGEVADWTIEDDGWSLVEPGLGRMHRRGRKALKKVVGGTRSSKAHRRLMRRVRDFGYALRLLEPTWPAPLTAMTHEIDRVAGRLQEADELQALLGMIDDDDGLVDGLAHDELRDRFTRLRDRFRDEALLVGRRVFSEKSDAFSDCLGVWWDAWEDETGLPAES